MQTEVSLAETVNYWKQVIPVPRIVHTIENPIILCVVFNS